MKNLFVILCLLVLFSCATAKEPVELKPISFVLIGEKTETRLMNGHFKDTIYYFYRGDDGITYRIPSFLGRVGILYVRR